MYKSISEVIVQVDLSLRTKLQQMEHSTFRRLFNISAHLKIASRQVIDLGQIYINIIICNIFQIIENLNGRVVGRDLTGEKNGGGSTQMLIEIALNIFRSI